MLTTTVKDFVATNYRIFPLDNGDIAVNVDGKYQQQDDSLLPAEGEFFQFEKDSEFVIAWNALAKNLVAKVKRKRGFYVSAKSAAKKTAASPVKKERSKRERKKK